MRLAPFRTDDPAELKRQLAELERQLIVLKLAFDAYVKAHP